MMLNHVTSPSSARAFNEQDKIKMNRAVTMRIAVDVRDTVSRGF